MIEIRIVGISDIHGHLPHVPPCDLLCIAGDIGYGFRDEVEDFVWWCNEFAPWLEQVPAENVVGIAGNHDFFLERGEHDFADAFDWTYLQDESVEIAGLKVHGSPWQPYFGGWAFNAPEYDPNEKFLREKFRMIPEDADIVITHSPPSGILDKVGGRNVGSKALSQNLQRVCPRLALFGHVHHSYGVEERNGVKLANCSQTSVVGGRYVPDNEPLVFDI